MKAVVSRPDNVLLIFRSVSPTMSSGNMRFLASEAETTLSASKSEFGLHKKYVVPDCDVSAATSSK